MLFPQTCQYAMRAMAVLASLPPGAAMPAKELAGITEIPSHYLSKIMRRLVMHKLVASRKGHGGGFSLNKPAKQIRFADIFEAADYHLDTGRCAYGWGRCSSDPSHHCPLHESFSALRGEVLGWLEGRTLDEVGRDSRVDGRV